MNNNIRIIDSISIDKVFFIKVKDSTLDLQKRILDYKLSIDNIKRLFGFDLKTLIEDYDILNEYKNIYVCDINGKKYSLFNCIFGFSLNKEYISIKSASIDLIYENGLEDSNDIIINKNILITSMPKKFGNYIRNIHLKYNRDVSISITKSYEEKMVYIKYSIESKSGKKYKKLMKTLYSILELTFLLLGDIPKIEKHTIIKDAEINLYYEIVPKYLQRYNIYTSSNNGVLAYIDNCTITKKNIENFEIFRRETKIIFDLLLTNMNTDGYKEISNSMFVQMLEGLYKTVFKVNRINVAKILKYYFEQNTIIKTLMSKRDKKDSGDVDHNIIFIYKAKEHRNYIAHLNMNVNKKFFYKLENIYAYWKLSLALRLFIMERVGIDINEFEFYKTKRLIEEWAINRKLRYKK